MFIKYCNRAHKVIITSPAELFNYKDGFEQGSIPLQIPFVNHFPVMVLKTYILCWRCYIISHKRFAVEFCM